MMAEPAKDILDKAEEVLRAGKYTEALKMLEELDPTTLGTRSRIWYCILLSEAGLYVGAPPHEPIDLAFVLLTQNPDHDLLARARYAKGWLLTTLGQHREARELLLESYGYFLHYGMTNMVSRTLNRIAYLDFIVGDVDSGIRNLERCLAITKVNSGERNYVTTAVNLASLYVRAGRFGEALPLYKRHLDVHDEFDDASTKDLLTSLSALSRPLAFLGRLAEARQYLSKSKQYWDEYPREKAISLGNLGLVDILAGSFDSAEATLTQALELSLPIAPESSLVSAIKRLFGDLYIATEKFDLAEQHATETLIIAEKINERVEIAASWRIFAQVEQHRSNAIKAREWYQKAMDLFGHIASRYQLAVTQYLAAISGVYGEGERTALLYMARDYFEAEGVAPFIEKVDALIPEAARVDSIVKKSTPVSNGGPFIIAESQIMKELLDLAEHVAQSEMTVFLTGDTGTGKDIFARYIHFCSGRKGEFVTVNAAAIPNPMIEAELFGHTKGAFTSAASERKGLLEQAHNGTFYLNEIADATPEFQAKLLEVLETHEVRKLGSNKSTKVNFRLIAATNHDLKARMRDGHFRVDLYHRLNEIPLTLPPLSARTEDIGPLVQHFLKEAGYKLNGDGTARFASVLALAEYPGNVRELQAKVKQLLTVGKGDIDRMIALAEQIESERDRTLKALESCDWNRREAADLLGVSEATVRRRIEKYALAQPVID